MRYLVEHHGEFHDAGTASGASIPCSQCPHPFRPYCARCGQPVASFVLEEVRPSGAITFVARCHGDESRHQVPEEALAAVESIFLHRVFAEELRQPESSAGGELHIYWGARPGLSSRDGLASWWSTEFAKDKPRPNILSYRVHEDDLAPAPARPLWPERWSPLRLAPVRERHTAPYEWLRLYQGLPRAEGVFDEALAENARRRWNTLGGAFSIEDARSLLLYLDKGIITQEEAEQQLPILLSVEDARRAVDRHDALEHLLSWAREIRPTCLLVGSGSERTDDGWAYTMGKLQWVLPVAGRPLLTSMEGVDSQGILADEVYEEVLRRLEHQLAAICAAAGGGIGNFLTPGASSATKLARLLEKSPLARARLQEEDVRPSLRLALRFPSSPKEERALAAAREMSGRQYIASAWHKARFPFDVTPLFASAGARIAESRRQLDALLGDGVWSLPTLVSVDPGQESTGVAVFDSSGRSSTGELDVTLEALAAALEPMKARRAGDVKVLVGGKTLGSFASLKAIDYQRELAGLTILESKHLPEGTAVLLEMSPPSFARAGGVMLRLPELACTVDPFEYTVFPKATTVPLLSQLIAFSDATIPGREWLLDSGTTTWRPYLGGRRLPRKLKARVRNEAKVPAARARWAKGHPTAARCECRHCRRSRRRGEGPGLYLRARKVDDRIDAYEFLLRGKAEISLDTSGEKPTVVVKPA